MKIKFPTSWEQLNPWQLTEIVSIIDRLRENEDFTHTYIRMVQILLMKNNSLWQYLKMRRILRNIPLSAFQEATAFLIEQPKLYRFPAIKGAIAPADRIGDCTMEQFSFADTLLYRYHSTDKEDERNLYARQIVAVLYRITPQFDKAILPKVAAVTDNIPMKQARTIVFIFSSIRNYITEIYPAVFSKPKKETTAPDFSSKKHIPFSKIVTMMAADELRLLGNLKECQNTLVYEFFNAFLESKRIHELKAKVMKQ